MGNLWSCFSGEGEETEKAHNKVQQRRTSRPTDRRGPLGSSARLRRVERPLIKGEVDEALIHERTSVDALLQHCQTGNNGLLPLDRSSSLRLQTPEGGKNGLSRTTSSRRRSLGDPLLRPQQLVSQDLKTGDLETNYFVLVHGGGFGAWCWYKTITLLEECGFKVAAIDLTGSGINSSNSNNITNLSQYVKPLTSFLDKLVDEKVILVGHDFGGVCISYAMESFPSKIAKAVFISAAMLTNGQNALDMFSKQVLNNAEYTFLENINHKEVGPNDLIRQAQIFSYANGSDQPPTAIDLDKSLLKDLLFNESPSKDVALASVSMRPIPFAPVLEKLSLSDEKYGSVRRFYIETAKDNAIPLTAQQNLINLNPPERVFHLKGSDHSPFFSKPQALHKHLVEIATAPPLPAG